MNFRVIIDELEQLNEAAFRFSADGNYAVEVNGQSAPKEAIDFERGLLNKEIDVIKEIIDKYKYDPKDVIMYVDNVIGKNGEKSIEKRYSLIAKGERGFEVPLGKARKFTNINNSKNNIKVTKII